MAITILGVNAPITDAVNNLEMIDGSLWTVIDTSFDSETGSRETLYQRIDGDARYPTTVRIGVYPKTSNGNVTYNVSIRQNGYVLDDLPDPDVYEPYTAVLAWTMPWMPAPNVTNLFSLVQNLLSWAIPDVVTGALDDAFLSKVAYGLTELDLANITHS